jgi:hypothetical protein
VNSGCIVVQSTEHGLVYALFPSPVSDGVNVDLYSLIFLRKPVADKFS